MDGMELPVSISTKSLTERNLDVKYPVISGLSNLPAEEKINSAIFQTVNKVISDQGYYQNPRTEVSGYYEVKTNERGVLSLTIINDAYAGGVHGFRIIKSITADTRTGKIYQLKDLFKPGVDYVKRLSAIATKQIKERGIYLLGQFTGIKPDQDFYIADKTLVIYFQLYELTSYAFGFPHFVISVYDIKDMIPNQGILDILSF